MANRLGVSPTGHRGERGRCRARNLLRTSNHLTAGWAEGPRPLPAQPHPLRQTYTTSSVHAQQGKTNAGKELHGKAVVHIERGVIYPVTRPSAGSPGEDLVDELLEGLLDALLGPRAALDEQQPVLPGRRPFIQLVGGSRSNTIQKSELVRGTKKVGSIVRVKIKINGMRNPK